MFTRDSRYSFKKGAPRNFFTTPFFNLKYEKNNLLKPMIAVVVSKKVDSLATVRNKAKRRFIEYLKKSLKEDFSYNLVFSLKNKILKEDAESIKKEIERTLESLK